MQDSRVGLFAIELNGQDFGRYQELDGSFVISAPQAAGSRSVERLQELGIRLEHFRVFIPGFVKCPFRVVEVSELETKLHVHGTGLDEPFVGLDSLVGVAGDERIRRSDHVSLFRRELGADIYRLLRGGRRVERLAGPCQCLTEFRVSKRELGVGLHRLLEALRRSKVLAGACQLRALAEVTKRRDGLCRRFEDFRAEWI